VLVIGGVLGVGAVFIARRLAGDDTSPDEPKSPVAVAGNA
jgi:hypothetical protein